MGTPRFSDRKTVVALALLCCLLWGSSYPAIKTGYEWFGIAAHDVFVRILEHPGVGRFVDGFAGVNIEFRLYVEALQMAESAAEEDPDHGFRPRGEVRLPGGRGPRLMRSGPAGPLEHGGQGEAGEAHAGIGEEGAAGNPRAAAVSGA